MLPNQTNSAVTCLMILMVFNQPARQVIANARLPLLINPQSLPRPQYITVTGCSSDCDIACCYCDIRRQPPICVQCCNEDP
ncbi:hypothetical protein CDL12_20413 [Handroanthus impetiginosus]|uniref:Uncharacterized protein n=1 Tax=Handroanthus impetiginosus TaxID=429701 RepID=A0A2G9GPT9_9LAMI|nr:hypothetical protein CDL12_20413 [Handroanthus impetiginosus]